MFNVNGLYNFNDNNNAEDNQSSGGKNEKIHIKSKKWLTYSYHLFISKYTEEEQNFLILLFFIYVAPTQSDIGRQYSDAHQMDCIVYSKNRFSFEISNI